jgi:hypothetical protein
MGTVPGALHGHGPEASATAGSGQAEQVPAGQGHDLRPRSHSEERADLRGDHPPGPGRVAVYIPVNA